MRRRRKPYIFAFQLLLFAGARRCGGPIPTGGPCRADQLGRSVAATVGGRDVESVFNNAQLPNIVRPERMGWLSGFGWGLGYCGGLISLFIVLAAQFSHGPDPSHVLERLVALRRRCGCALRAADVPVQPDQAGRAAHVVAGRCPSKVCVRWCRRCASCAISGMRSPT